LQRRYHRELAAYERLPSNEQVREPKPEPPERYVVWNSTVEKLGEQLARSGRGLLLKQDEIAGWIGMLDKYSSGKGGMYNRAFYLKLYDGVSYSMDRKSGAVWIETMSASFMAGIQPERLAEMRGLTSDGLLQRLLPTVMTGTSLPKDRSVNTAAYDRLIRDLINTFDHLNPLLQFADDAQGVIMDTITHLYKVNKVVAGLSSGLQGFIGKLDGVIGSLALNLHFAEFRDEGLATKINKKTACNVQRLIRDYLIPHGLEFYRSVDAVTNSDRLRKLASFILTNNKPRIVMSDLTSNIAEFRGRSVVEVNEFVSPLVAAGWLAPAEGERGNWCRAWMVDPRVFTQFDKRMREEEERKQTLAELMNSGRRGRART
jgi:hypothetical protein